MNVLVLGAGLQGRAVLHDLNRSPLVEKILAADVSLAGAGEFVARNKLAKVELVAADALAPEVLAGLIARIRARAVVCMLPAHLSGIIARGAIEAGVPFVNTSYGHWVADLDGLARERGVSVLPEMGFDPGLDLMAGRLAVDDLDVVEGMYSYGAGVPEPAAADNAIKYKITWTFDGVLKAYKRSSRLIRGGAEVEIPGLEIFRPENIHLIDVPGAGQLEAYPNGDAVQFVETFGLDRANLKDMGRFAARWPGHCAFWRVMAEMGFLEDTPLDLGGGRGLSPHEFLVRHLGPRLNFLDHQRDLAILRVQTWGRRAGRGLQHGRDRGITRRGRRQSPPHRRPQRPRLCRRKLLSRRRNRLRVTGRSRAPGRGRSR